MTNPWLTLALMTTGMMLLISQLMSLGPWGKSGTAGVVCLGAVMAMYAWAHELAWTAAILIAVGIALLIIESRVLPGYVVSGVGGLACLFTGLNLMLAAWGMVYSILTSALMTMLAVVAFLVHLPRNPKWQTVGRKLEISVGRRQSKALGHAEITGTGKTTIKRTPHTKPTTTEDSEDQQIIRREE